MNHELFWTTSGHAACSSNCMIRKFPALPDANPNGDCRHSVLHFYATFHRKPL
jgi:hypothetical protein